MATLTWLHVSDWHQTGTEFEREMVRDALLADVGNRERIAPQLRNIDFVVFSGDIANYGKEDEYRAARKHLIEPLLSAAGVAPQRLFTVPGNHDLDWGLRELLPCALLKPLKNSGEVNYWLTDPRRSDRLVEPFTAYSAFVSDYCGANRSAKGYVERFDAAGKKIAIVGLNSSFMSARMKGKTTLDDRNNIVLGEPQVHRALAEAAGADITVAILHHPFDWFAEFDLVKTKPALSDGCHFILNGHQHRTEAQSVAGNQGSYVWIPAGACYSRPSSLDDEYWNSYNFVHLDFDRGSGSVYFRLWGRRKWLEDTITAKAGRWNFRLPKSLVPPRQSTPKPPRAPRVSKREQSPASSPVYRVRGREYVLIPAGAFTMGTTSQRVEELVAETRQDRFRNELHQHSVNLGSYYIGKYPVTNAEYAEFVRETGHALRSHDDDLSQRLRWDPETKSYPQGLDNHPVVLVSWFDAREYCRWLGGRLPSEAEWEKAARGTAGFEWPWGSDWEDKRCNSWELRLAMTTAVGQFSPAGDSPYGVADMGGNSAEWCNSLERSYPYKADDGREAEGGSGRRVIRGGAFILDRKAARCAFRDASNPNEYGPTMGFRVVLDRAAR